MKTINITMKTKSFIVLLLMIFVHQLTYSRDPLIITPGEINLPYTNATTTFYVDLENGAWSIQEYCDWLSIDNIEFIYSTTNKTVTLTATDNPSANPRTFTLEVKKFDYKGDHASTKLLKITQAGAPPTLSLSSSTIIVGAASRSTATLNINLNAIASLGTINWYTAATGGTSLASGAAFETPEIKATSTYYVDATLGGCTSAPRTEVVATIDNCTTGLNNVEEEHTITVYPNPTQGLVEVTFDDFHEGGKIEVYNMVGELLQTQIILQNTQKVQFDLSQYPSGIFNIRFITGSQIFFKKVIKTNK